MSVILTVFIALCAFRLMTHRSDFPCHFSDTTQRENVTEERTPVSLKIHQIASSGPYAVTSGKFRVSLL
jgi:hypothetical protein